MKHAFKLYENNETKMDCDSSENENDSDECEENEIISNKNNLIKKGIRVETGKHSDLVYDADFWVISPGVAKDIDIINQASKLEIPIIGEIEFASRFTNLPIIAVTGSNGKSTTVNILYSMLKTDSLKPILAGNIGIPFSAIICVYLNISPDHLDRHKNMDEYKKMKLKMIKNHKNNDTVVYNKDDSILSLAFNDYKIKKLFSVEIK